MAKKIITVLSRFNGTEIKDEPYAYPAPMQGEVPGTQTNEPALRYFLKEYCFDAAADRILALCTDETLLPLTSFPGLSTVDLVQSQLKKFCSENALPCPAWEIIRFHFDEEHRGAGVSDILSRIEPGDEIFIDMTGGPRDANFLNILLMQALEFKGCNTREMIYASYAPKKLHKLDDLTRIMDITNAMAEFTTYGRARLFNKMKPYLDAPTQDFVSTLSDFSELLETCRFQNDGRKTLNDLLKKLSSAIKRLESEDAGEPSSNSTDPSSRMLMRQMIPVFREKLQFKDNKISLISVVRWCASNHMLQQSATIFNENLFEFLQGSNKILCIDPDKKNGGVMYRYAQAVSALVVHECVHTDYFGHDYSSDLEDYRRQKLSDRKEWFVAALEADSLKPSCPEEQALLLLLKCLFQDSVTLREKKDAVLYAQKHHLEVLYPFLRSFYAKKSSINTADAPVSLPEDVLAQLSEPAFFSALTRLYEEISLAKIGTITQQIIREFMYEDKISPAHLSYTDRIIPHVIRYCSQNISFVDLGLLLMEYHVIRLTRNQMNHSDTIEYDTTGEYLDDKLRKDLRTMHLDEVIVNLPVKLIQKHLFFASDRLQRISAQHQAAISFGLPQETIPPLKKAGQRPQPSKQTSAKPSGPKPGWERLLDYKV